ncbi:hypothetical protein HDC92_004793 [Pedobacter sp. AK017]|nr:hypothetical protein [Pedobacter sp. AK017]
MTSHATLSIIQDYAAYHPPIPNTAQSHISRLLTLRSRNYFFGALIVSFQRLNRANLIRHPIDYSMLLVNTS